MGHTGMLYSLPSREIIADSVEYMCNAHKVDALVCISNCDKITPGMLIAAMRLNIPTIFVSGGPMEAGVINKEKYDLIDAMVMALDSNVNDATLDAVEKNACPTCGSCSGMFTANSMNCLTEALGLSLPGNGSIVATHKNRENLFIRAAKQIVENTKKYYYDGDTSVLPRSIATRAAFLNSMKMDIAMGGSSNTVLHLLAVAHEAGVEFKMKDIDMLSRQVPCICKVAPNTKKYHIEDVNRAGGVMGILGVLDRNGLLDTSVKRVDGLTLKEALDSYDILRPTAKAELTEIYKSAPKGDRTTAMGSQNTMYKEFDTDRENGCIRDIKNAYTKDGGLAVLFGNIAKEGCIVKVAGVDESLFTFKGTAKVFHSQEDACEAIITDKIQAGDVVVIIYEGPKGGPGMQEMLYPTSYLKSKHLGKACALITDGRFSGGTSGLSIGHVSPEAASGGEIGLVRDGDSILFDIPNRKVELLISDQEMEKRRTEELAKGKNAFKPNRERFVPDSLKVYAQNVASADLGGVRVIE